MQSNNRICLVRHGETYANIEQVWHGQTDTQLTERGYQQAQQLAQHFHHYVVPDVIYSSPLQRARITAEAVAERFGLSVTLDSRLMEFDMGDWEGMTFDKMKHGSDIFEQLMNDPEFSAPNGESQNNVKERVVAAFEEFQQRHQNQTILIVAHGVSLGIALSHYLHNDTRRWNNYRQRNTAFSELCLSSKKLLCFNTTDHLSE